MINNIQQGISLKEFNERIKGLLYNSQVQRCWVVAETSDLRVARGHCYLELIQKNEKGDTIARASAAIWASAFSHLNFRFREVTGQNLASGMKVMVNVSATFHELYGMKLVVNDIDPQYTLGDMARLRMEIIKRLTDEGTIDLNRSLPLPKVPQRIAIISAAGAAGYGDFIKQLHGNSYGLKFYTALFSASMQGADTVPSIIKALNRIAANEECFDCVAIIRGGGATSDLNSFDNYDLATNVAQFPLPVITGIGHDRDTTVLDHVAAWPVKTPTAAAQFIITCGVDALATLDNARNAISQIVGDSIARAAEQLAYYNSLIPMAARKVLGDARHHLDRYLEKLPLLVDNRLDRDRRQLAHLRQNISLALPQLLERERTRLANLDSLVAVLSPRNTLNRGYSLTMAAGRIITDATAVPPGTAITTHLKSGTLHSTTS